MDNYEKLWKKVKKMRWDSVLDIPSSLKQFGISAHTQTLTNGIRIVHCKYNNEQRHLFVKEIIYKDCVYYILV